MRLSFTTALVICLPAFALGGTATTANGLESLKSAPLQALDKPVAQVQGTSPEKEPRKKKDIEEKGKRRDACNCCRHCKAATHTVRSKEEGPPARNGCKDCCEKCGAADLPTPENMPPERFGK